MAVPLNQQPSIVELAAVKLDDQTLDQVAELSFLCKPPTAIEPDAFKASGITMESLADKPPFVHFLPAVAEFFCGERVLVAHNAEFDRKLLMFELQRVGKMCNFPWPYVHVCTVEATFHLRGHRLKLTELYEHALNKKLDQKHRALDDVYALADVVRWARQEGLL